MSESAMLSVTPQLQQTLLNSPQTQNTYKKSVQLFGEIQKLKENNQDTTKLETLYADSVKDLTNQHTKDAENKLQTIETVIAGINLTLSVTPSLVPSGTFQAALLIRLLHQIQQRLTKFKRIPLLPVQILQKMFA